MSPGRRPRRREGRRASGGKRQGPSTHVEPSGPRTPPRRCPRRTARSVDPRRVRPGCPRRRASEAATGPRPNALGTYHDSPGLDLIAPYTARSDAKVPWFLEDEGGRHPWRKLSCGGSAQRGPPAKVDSWWVARTYPPYKEESARPVEWSIRA